MNPNLQNLLAVLAGIIVGSIVNMGIVMLGSTIIPPPTGIDVTDVQQIASSMHLFKPYHFIFPFLAHAAGAFTGALVAATIGVNSKMMLAFIIGIINLLGGVMNSFMLPAPTWFIIVDILLAYLPMAWLAGKLALRKK